MTKRGERNIYGLLSTLTGIGEQYYRNKYAQDLAAQQAQAKIDEDLRKRQTEREDWLWKLGIQQDIKSQEEAQKDYLKQQQAALDQEIANMLIAGKAPLERPIPSDESQRLPSVGEYLPPEMAGIQSRIEQEQGYPNLKELESLPYAPGASSKLMTESPIPFQESYGLLTQIQDPQTQSIARKILEERYKPKEQTQIVPANKVPGFEKLGKDYIVPVKVTTDPATGEVSYEPTGTKPYRLPTHIPHSYDTFEPASNHIENAPEGMVIKVTTKVDEFGNVTKEKTNPFSMTTNTDGKNILTKDARDMLGVIVSDNIRMVADLERARNSPDGIEMFDKNGKPVFRAKDLADYQEPENDYSTNKVNKWNLKQVTQYWDARRNSYLKTIKKQISPEALWVWDDAYKKYQDDKKTPAAEKHLILKNDTIQNLYKYIKTPGKDSAMQDMLSVLLQTYFGLSPADLDTELRAEGLGADE